MEESAGIDFIIADLIDRCFGTINTPLVLDFSASFKPKKKIKRVPKNLGGPNDQEIIEIELPEVIEIPDNLVSTPEEMASRKFLDLKRWLCMSRPQYSKSCGITSLVSCWNYLYSTLGYGKRPVLSQEKALITLGIEPPFHDIRFGPFTGNNTLINWFTTINLTFGLKGKAKIFWKLHGKNRTETKSKEQALEELKSGLMSKNKAYIYHCFNHYMCPIGFEIAPLIPSDAYKPLAAINPNELQPFIIIGEASKAYPIFHVKKWDEIALDIDQQNPYYYNIRKSEKGVQARTAEAFVTGDKLGKNLHCLIEFESLED
jgi:hypothetical protein